MKDKKIKDLIANCTAVGSFTIGWVLVIVNFFIDPVGEISDSTQWILAQALIYCGSVLGIVNYVNYRFDIKEKKING